jgi:hypothetical protein
MLWHIYVRDGKVYAPTTAQTEAGYYLEIEPVDVVELTDTASICGVISRILKMGNPIVQTPTRAAFPKWVVLEAAGIKSIKAFERTAQLWIIQKTPSYFRIRQACKSDGGGWDGDIISQDLPVKTEFGELAVAFVAAIRR